MRVNKAGIASSNKTGLVYKVSFALVLLLGLLVYKLNDYFKNDKTDAMQNQVRKRVVSIKTSVSGQLSQVRNTLSSYETDLNEANMNWVQLDPFFTIARVDNSDGRLRVSQIVTRSGAPGERWTGSYLEKALRINQARAEQPIRVQLFKDHAGTKFVVVRFNIGGSNELVVATLADYFQKYFDIERGSRNTSLLVTTERVLAGHTEADYIGSPTKEASLSAKSYIIEKEEITGTNLMAVSYVLRSKVAPGFVVPWSIVGVVVGFGFVLVAILFYALDPIERRVERYRKQEREQIYKDTVQNSLNENAPPALSVAALNSSSIGYQQHQRSSEKPLVPPLTESTQTAWTPQPQEDAVTESISVAPVPVPWNIEVDDEAVPHQSKIEIIDLLERAPKSSEARMSSTMQNVPESEEMKTTEPVSEQFVTLDEEKIDLDEIEKALALDDFDQDVEQIPPVRGAADNALERNLQPQKVSLDSRGSKVEEPRFVFDKKDFKVDEFKVNIRRPERS